MRACSSQSPRATAIPAAPGEGQNGSRARLTFLLLGRPDLPSTEAPEGRHWPTATAIGDTPASACVPGTRVVTLIPPPLGGPRAALEGCSDWGPRAQPTSASNPGSCQKPAFLCLPHGPHPPAQAGSGLGSTRRLSLGPPNGPSRPRAETSPVHTGSRPQGVPAHVKPPVLGCRGSTPATDGGATQPASPVPAPSGDGTPPGHSCLGKTPAGTVTRPRRDGATQKPRAGAPVHSGCRLLPRGCPLLRTTSTRRSSPVPGTHVGTCASPAQSTGHRPSEERRRSSREPGCHSGTGLWGRPAQWGRRSRGHSRGLACPAELGGTWMTARCLQQVPPCAALVMLQSLRPATQEPSSPQQEAGQERGAGASGAKGLWQAWGRLTSAQRAQPRPGLAELSAHEA